MIPKSGCRFSDKIMLHEQVETGIRSVPAQSGRDELSTQPQAASGRAAT